MDNQISNRELSKTDLHVQEVIRTAELELLMLLQQRAELMKRIGSIKQTLVGLANMFGDDVLNERLLGLLDRSTSRRSTGFTQSCRAVLMESPMPISVREVCELLKAKFPGLLEKHKKPTASVTTVLNRLVEYDEARSSQIDGKGRVWQWVAEREHKDGAFLVQAQQFETLEVDPRNVA
jgi:chorismate mutase